MSSGQLRLGGDPDQAASPAKIASDGVEGNGDALAVLRQAATFEILRRQREREGRGDQPAGRLGLHGLARQNRVAAV